MYNKKRECLLQGESLGPNVQEQATRSAAEWLSPAPQHSQTRLQKKM